MLSMAYVGRTVAHVTARKNWKIREILTPAPDLEARRRHPLRHSASHSGTPRHQAAEKSGQK